MKPVTIGGTLAALASIVTIVGFFTAHHSPPPPTPPTPTPTYSTPPTLTPTPAPTTPPVYQSNVANSYLSKSEQNINVSQSQFMQDMAALNQYEQGVTSNPPPDMVKATVACSTNGS